MRRTPPRAGDLARFPQPRWRRPMARRRSGEVFLDAPQRDVRVERRSTRWSRAGASTCSAGPLGIPLSLGAYPGSGILIPLMARIGDGAQRGFDVIPSPFVIESPSDQSCDERTTPSGPCPTIQVFNKIVIQLNVYSHVRYYTHTMAVAGLESGDVSQVGGYPRSCD